MTANREKTNSITHLVKVVAGEVFDERASDNHKEHKTTHDRLEAELRTLKRKVNLILHCLGDEIPRIEDCPGDWKKPNAGSFWSDREEAELMCDFYKAVQWMASRQGRTTGAIEARLVELRRRGEISL